MSNPLFFPFVVVFFWALFLLAPLATSHSQEVIQMPWDKYINLLENLEQSSEKQLQAESLSRSLLDRMLGMQTSNDGLELLVLNLRGSVLNLETINSELRTSSQQDKENLEKLSISNNLLQVTSEKALSTSEALKSEIFKIEGELVVWKIVGITGATIGVVALVKLALDELRR